MTKKKIVEEAVEVKVVEPVRLSLACGQNKPEGWIGIDIADTEEADIVHDLEVFPWPFEDNSVDEAQAIHFVEHIKDLIGFMNELHRVMKPGAICTIICPYYSSMRAWQDPTHVRAISEASFLYFNQDWMKSQKLDHYGVTADFDFSYGYIPNDLIANRSEEFKQFAIAHYINAVNDIQVILTKKA